MIAKTSYRSIDESAPFRWILKISGMAALTAGGLLLLAVFNLLLHVQQPGVFANWFSFLSINWLLIIFSLHSAIDDIFPVQLYQLNSFDVVILALIAIMYVGLYASLRDTSRIWTAIALVQPFLGLCLYIATKSVGRSGVMGAGLVISFVMLRSKFFNYRIAYLGLLSSALLLAGDLGASAAPSLVLAILTGLGYLFLITWLFIVGFKLIQFRKVDAGNGKVDVQIQFPQGKE